MHSINNQNYTPPKRQLNEQTKIWWDYYILMAIQLYSSKVAQLYISHGRRLCEHFKEQIPAGLVS